MLAERHELALQLAVAAKLYPEWTMSDIATAIGWPPLFLINAFDEGQAMELFTIDREKDTVELTSPHPLSGQSTIYSMGIELGRLTDEILFSIANANKQEQDVSREQLEWSWLRGLPKIHWEIAIENLLHAELIAEYKMNDPYDEESVYTFYSLVSNSDNRWGSKQFKPRSKANKKRMKKERGDK